ncbi:MULTISPECIES: aldose epimerase family protein [unclassified Chelatococcus]|uniref:aldose epimerase family protein n=1 Tax=unclassified Chelatococcus TaxID=2638111 RepID=UPI001BCEC1AE|nr:MULTISPECIES: aldose epimerase family protein [unclassified Chelatococcus]MBS7698490.1 galactose mutarotase [Chelatococcus sp. YT9]MBX3554859.1 galactose mutarotase [Chelatococcus sp.]
MSVRQFGEIEGTPVWEITIRSSAGAEAKILSWGAVVRDMTVPLQTGARQRVVLGLNTIDDYLAHSPHMGAIAGRCANRISNGRFKIGDATYELERNFRDKHTLHSGKSFGKSLWQLAHRDRSSVTLTYVSPNGDSGFPGTVTTTCTYRLLEPATLRVELTATTDAPTPVNLAHHSYFNLDGSPSILDHRLTVSADFYTPTDAELIPTGEIRTVGGTPYDFRSNRSVRFPDAETGAPYAYDANFVLRRDRIEAAGWLDLWLAHAAKFSSPITKLALDVWTTEPGVQVYDGRKLDVPVPGLDGATYKASAGLCLEPQHFPDSPNRPHFPSIILHPEDVYRQISEYRFQSA